MKFLNKTRRALYKSASVLGDVNALASGNPKKIIKRILRKQTGRVSGKTIRNIFK